MHTLRIAYGVIVIVLVLSVAAGAQQIADEYQVKAAYLYTIAELGRWPAKLHLAKYLERKKKRLAGVRRF
jgi:hypothetical protein